ncbi:glycosyltransferase family 2 protein [Bradyrhizobium genosp. L]|uniref:glycosyltransferase family 2 protein n=1 Tax=Bradyrhizobium genosp. L TaxID=83637 RepID=UPI0018A24B66|nr:glycosyltransferase family 2 protein [Bradyrhizobium genosp. L]QPF82998.1 glycosyltransferase family 2 protein [Bradyrhizobium genosp. L]
MKLSIVTTLYRSATTVEAFYQRAMTAAEAIFPEIELIMVNDGSPDDSLARALALQKKDPRIVVVDLARNFGHHKAMMTGLAYAAGDLVFLIDSDLEEKPEDLAALHQRFAKGDCDVVFGALPTRRGGFFERLPGALFFTLLDFLSDHPIPRNILTSRLMTRQYVQALLRHRDRAFSISHLWQVTGFRQQAIALEKLSASPTSYSLRHRVEMAIRDITTTSSKLLYLIFYVGASIFGLSIAVILFVLWRYFAIGIAVSGFTSVIISIWFLGGLITLILGILGIYIANILAETKRRPYTIVRKAYRSDAPAIVPLPRQDQPEGSVR